MIYLANTALPGGGTPAREAEPDVTEMDDVAAGRTGGRSAGADEQKPAAVTGGTVAAARGVSSGMNALETGMLRRQSELAGRVSFFAPAAPHD